MTDSQPLAGMSDQALVARYRTGVEEAAAELVRRHAAALGRFLYARGAPWGEIEDLVQETFFRAFRALDTWRGDAAFRSWLFRIGSNLGRDLHRKEAGRVVIPLVDGDLVDRSDPAGEAAARDAEDRLRDEVERLPRLQREVFLLRAMEGMEYAAIAETCGTTPGAARVHYHHAVQRLKGIMT